MPKPKLEITDEQLKQVIAEVEAQVETMLYKSEPLAKGFPPKDDEPAAEDEGKSAAAPEDKGPSADAPADPPDAAAVQEEAPMDAAPAAPAAPAPAMAPPVDPGMDAGMGLGDALKAEYAALPPEELRAHWEAISGAVMDMVGGQMAADPGMAPEIPAPMAPAPAMPAMPAIPGAAPPELAMKNELEAGTVTPAGAGEDHLAPLAPTKAGAGEDHLEAVSVHKSQLDEANKEIESLKKSQKDTEETLGQFTKAFEVLLNKPQRQAITSLSAIGKPGSDDAPKVVLSKSQVMDKLRVITCDPTLKKSDRDLIDSYCVSKVSLDKIEHLLK